MKEKQTIMGNKDRVMTSALMERMVQEYATQVQIMETVIQSYEERLAKLIARRRPLSTKGVVVPLSVLKENVRILKNRLTLLTERYSQNIARLEMALEERLAKSNDLITMLLQETGVARAEVIVSVVRGYKDRIRYLEGENARLWDISRNHK
jgi:hypothetical protein